MQHTNLAAVSIFDHASMAQYGTNQYYLWNKSTNIWQLLMVQYKHTFWQFWTWLDIAHYWNVLYADELKQQCKKS